jgi:hypothetical protein
MNGRRTGALLVVALGGLVSAQGRLAGQPVIVNSDSSLHVQIRDGTAGTVADGYRQTVQSRKIAVAQPLPTYGPDAASTLVAALAAARTENRRVLIQWGTNGDPASDALIQVLTKGAEVPRTLMYEYEIVRAELKGNESLAAKYRVKAPMPHLTVLDAQGKLLANQPVATFKAAGEGAAAYDATKLNEFFKTYQAAHVAAEPLLTEALGRAKKDQKTLFLWFSAPW